VTVCECSKCVGWATRVLDSTVLPLVCVHYHPDVNVYMSACITTGASYASSPAVSMMVHAALCENEAAAPRCGHHTVPQILSHSKNSLTLQQWVEKPTRMHALTGAGCLVNKYAAKSPLITARKPGSASDLRGYGTNSSPTRLRLR
jgi:hypothetical protein